MSGCVVRIRRRADRIEIALGSGFTNADLRLVKSIPGRRWNPERKVWTVPDPDAALRTLTEHFGSDRLHLTHVTGASFSEKLPDPLPPMLERVGQRLLLNGYSARTRKVYLGHLRRFIEWCGMSSVETSGRPSHSMLSQGRPPSQETCASAKADRPEERLQALPDAEAEDLVRRYLIHLVVHRDVSRSYHNQAVSALRFLFETVLERPRLGVRIPRPGKRPRLPEVLSPEEVKRLLDKPRNLKHRALLVLLYSAGLRVSEVVRLRPRDLDQDRGLLRVRGGKGGKDRNTLLARRAIEVVHDYRAAYATDRWLFPGARPDRHLTTRSVQRVVARAAEAAGIRKRVTPHTLRHSFATHLLEGGTNLRIIQELLGHNSARTTQIYTRVTQTTLQTVRSPVDNLPD